MLENWTTHDIIRQDPSSISQGFLALAGSWQLRKCMLRGRFCLSTAIALLPTTLQALELWPESAPAVSHLSSFQRFARLQVLKLGVGISNPVPDFEGEDLLQFKLVLDTAMPTIESFAVIDRLRATLLGGHTISNCLPRVQRATLNLEASAAGLQLAQDILEIRSLLDLRLYLEDGSGHLTMFTVPMAGRLQKLFFQGPPSTLEVSVLIQKASLRYICNRVCTVSSVDAVREFDCRPEISGAYLV